MKQNMFKKGVVLAAAVLLLGGGVAQAASVTCEVVKVEGATVVLDCGEKAEKLSGASTVKIKAKKAKKAIEGC